ncbi:MAG: RNase adapter RapZ [Dysosmobacter welbionis]
MEILIISGLSGAGKSKAASFLEDMGFYIVDNMPAAMILKFCGVLRRGQRPLRPGGPGVRRGTASSFTELFDVLDKLKDMEAQCRMLFLEAAPRSSSSGTRRPAAAIPWRQTPTPWRRR